MNVMRSAGAAVKAARAKAVEVLGEDTVENLGSWKDDLVSAGGKIREVAREVGEDCDNEVLQNAREFYGNAAGNADRAVKKSIQAAKDSADERRELRRAERQRREQDREKNRVLRRRLFRRAGVVLICLILAAAVVLSFAFRYAQRHSGTIEPASTPAAGALASPENLTADQASRSADLLCLSLFESGRLL